MPKAKRSAKPKEPTLSFSEKALLSEKEKKFNAKATAEDCISDLRKIQELHPLKHIVRNFYRHHGKYSDSTWGKHFGSFLEFRRQAGLELSRAQSSIERNIAKQAAQDHYREFFIKEVLPYHNKHELSKGVGGRYKTILVGSDFHDIECDPFVLSVFIDTAKRVQPDVIVLNGDVFDCYSDSRFSKDIRQLKIAERFEFVKKNIFQALRNACPKAQIDMILGNHEWRILNILADKTPNIRVLLSDVMGLTLADVFCVKEYKINLICKLDLGVFTKEDMKNELKQNHRIYFDCFVAGHFKDLGFGMSGSSGHCHRPGTETFTNVPMGRCFWVETGCICYTDAEYVQHREKWLNSFLLAHIDTKQRRVTPEHIIFTGDSIVVHGIRYEKSEKG